MFYDIAYVDSVGHTRATMRTYVSAALSCKHKLTDKEDPTTKVWVRKVINADTDTGIHTQDQMPKHTGDTQGDSLGSQSCPGRV